MNPSLSFLLFLLHHLLCPPIQESCPSFSPAPSNQMVWPYSVSKSVCKWVCAHVQQWFWGEVGKRRKSFFLCADREPSITDKQYHSWLPHMLPGWRLIWPSSSIHLKSFESAGHWRKVRRWHTTDGGQGAHFSVVMLSCVHSSEGLRKSTPTPMTTAHTQLVVVVSLSL